ncbi:MAG: hypothetical protein ACJ8F3_00060 [Xanthobacteraceae bacterium]
MLAHRICVIGLTIASILVWAVSSAVADPHDGNWKMLAWTTRGDCPGSHFAFVIIHGHITSAGTLYQGYPARLGGDVSRSGYLRSNAIAGQSTGSSTGWLRLYDGEGVWTARGPSGLCAGAWSAYRF